MNLSCGMMFDALLIIWAQRYKKFFMLANIIEKFSYFRYIFTRRS